MGRDYFPEQPFSKREMLMALLGRGSGVANAVAAIYLLITRTEYRKVTP